MKNRAKIHIIVLSIIALLSIPAIAWIAATTIASAAKPMAVKASARDSIMVDWRVPQELNPSGGGAPNATPDQAAAFAWQEFIALNWPAVPQNGGLNERGTAQQDCFFGSVLCSLLPTVWETFRGKVETFPGSGNPPGYVNNPNTSYGFDALPRYNYANPVHACDPAQETDQVPWLNLDETDQITLNNMYAGVVGNADSPGNSDPQLIRFLAKSNRQQFIYVAQQRWWDGIPVGIKNATLMSLANTHTSPPPGSTDRVSQLAGTIEIKAGWRPLTTAERSSGRFHIKTVRFYEPRGNGTCFRDAAWGLVALHIIQKTPSAPFFIYATFEQADNLLTPHGVHVEDDNGRIVLNPSDAKTPQVCMIDPKPPNTMPANDTPSNKGRVVLTGNPSTCTELPTAQYCADPGKRLYYRNEPATPPNAAPTAGNICVNKRDNAIPQVVIDANKAAHDAILEYIGRHGYVDSPWLHYKLVNIQYYPYNKTIPNPTPNGSLYNGSPPYSAAHPAPSSYYLANIVVETSRSLQLFSGGLSDSISTDWNMDGSLHQNMDYSGHRFNMGGCMGCHGSQGQLQAGDFSVILREGRTMEPETPEILTAKTMVAAKRNRKLLK